MQIVITSEGPDLDAAMSPTFGRCPYFLFVNTDTDELESVRNPSVDAAGGAGVQAAQQVVDHGARTVLTGRVGPKAARVLEAAGVEVCEMEVDQVREALQRFTREAPGDRSTADPNSETDAQDAYPPAPGGARRGYGHAGGESSNMERGPGRVQMRGQGRGQGRGPGRGLGRGLGRGQGRGQGRGPGQGRGRRST